jgi:HD-GYP domain-containing protein (c-di-GMP phosphodiesterase class II)
MTRPPTDFGRHAWLQSSARRRPIPDSALTRAAEELAQQRLSRALLNHSYRTYRFGAALGELENLDVDRELLYAAAMLHDVGHTRVSTRNACDIAEQVGLSTAATHILRTAITLHDGPGVTLAAGPVAYLLWAGAGLDVVLGAPFCG